jgi:protein Tex
MQIEQWLSSELKDIPLNSSLAVLKLVAEEATIPFIARYRKEQTGNLDEVQIEKVVKAKEVWEEVTKRKAYILEEIKKQEKLTPELESAILNTFNLEVLEDLYLPYKIKRKTKATTAKEAGLLPLADLIWEIGQGNANSDSTLSDLATKFINPEFKITTAEQALDGARHILMERVAETLELRDLLRKAVFSYGVLRCEKIADGDKDSKFENYYEHVETVESLSKPENSHRYLAIKRGESDGAITVRIELPCDKDESVLESFTLFVCKTSSIASELLKKVAQFAYKYTVYPAIELEVHRYLKDQADAAAIQVFAHNVRTVLLSSPFGAKTVLGVDPGFRTGCKLALINRAGSFVASSVVYPDKSGELERAKLLIGKLISDAQLEAIAIGNGTASRETEHFFRSVLKQLNTNIPIVLVSESGASIYSASEVARREFPELDLTIRGAISIARRFQDPLAELVKIDPKSIGVGQYQHDVNQSELKKSLTRVVESCVNSVGVNLNTASEHLLAYVAGIGPTLAKSIVSFREKVGLFKSRMQLLEIPRFGNKAFEQAAGFLRVANGTEPLDNTGVHPERYELIRQSINRLGITIHDILGGGAKKLNEDKNLKEELGSFTFNDVIEELNKPGRDPREEFTVFSFRDDINSIKDLREGMHCPGIVTNVTNFGAFVDIGVHQDGLVHISHLSDNFVKDPNLVVKPGDKVKVWVLDSDSAKKRISLSLKTVYNPNQPKNESRDQNTNSKWSGGVKQVKDISLGVKDNFSNNPFANLGSLKIK